MKEALWGYWLVVLGIFIIVVLLLVQSFTTTNTQDYYLIKSITEASMEDSIDWSYYRLYGELKINKEKFYETFLRRFAEEASLSSNYKIEFSGVYEAPPKVGVKISSKSSTFSIAGDSTTFDIVNKIDGILESKGSTYSVENLNNSSTAKPSGGNTTTTPGGNTTTTPGGNTTTNPGGNSGNTTTPGGNTGSSGGAYEIEENSCTKDIVTKWNSRVIQGASMYGNLGNVNIYGTLNDAKTFVNRIGQLEPGKTFTILGENGNFWAIKTDNQSCAWVQSRFMRINLEQYMPPGEYPISYNITNKSGSIFRVQGQEIPGVTKKALYTKDYVPLLKYSYAKKIKDYVMPLLKEKNYELVIYDAYRPYPVSTYVYQQVINNFAYLTYPTFQITSNCSSNYFNCADNGYLWPVSYFIAGDPNNHNYGCAIDATLKIGGKVMDTAYNGKSAMHEISSRSAVYKSLEQNNYNFRDEYKNDWVVNDLRNAMLEAPGVSILSSEWWHFTDQNCMGKVGIDVGYNSFWSAV